MGSIGIPDLSSKAQQLLWTNQIISKEKQIEKTYKNAWDLLEEMAGTYEAPEDWSKEHDRYLYGTPKRNLILKELFQNTSFEEIVQQIRQEVEENGLTPEILEELLKDE